MIDPKQFVFAVSQIAEEKNIPEDRIYDVIESAIAAAYKKDYGEKSQIIKAKINRSTGAYEIFQHKTVVNVDEEGYLIPGEGEEIEYDEEGNERKVRFNPDRHIPLTEAQEMNPEITEGEEVIEQLEPREDFGRIAAQTAKQVLMQRIREIERYAAFDEYKDKVGEIVTGTIQRIDRGIVFVELGKGVGLMFPSDQVRSDNYRVGNRYKFLIQNVEETERDPNIVLSRRNPEFVKTLFALEVPEIFAKTVEIVNIARDAGVRTKMAVRAMGPGIDPVGACVGQRGTRVQTVINELGGEKIDIIEYTDDLHEYMKAALAPAEVLDIKIMEEDKKAQVMVPEDQLSLAIGGSGQNVRLASRLVGYDIDLNPDTEESPAEESAPEQEDMPVESQDDGAPEPEVVEETVSAEDTTAPEESEQPEAPASEEEETKA